MNYKRVDPNYIYRNNDLGKYEKSTQTYGIFEPLFHKFYICSTLANEEDQYNQPEPPLNSLSHLAVKSKKLFTLLEMANN